MQKGEGAATVVSELRSSKINDEEILAHFGKRQQFKVRVCNIGETSPADRCRGTSAWCQFWDWLAHLVGVRNGVYRISTDNIEVLTWQGSVANLLPPLINGGPTGAIIAFPLVTFGVLTQVLVMAEMASMYVAKET
jgi:hypothetical protein